MSESATYAIPKNFADAHITEETYQTLYQQSLDDPNIFWEQQAKEQEALFIWQRRRRVGSECVGVCRSRHAACRRARVSRGC